MCNTSELHYFKIIRSEYLFKFRSAVNKQSICLMLQFFERIRIFLHEQLFKMKVWWKRFFVCGTYGNLNHVKTKLQYSSCNPEKLNNNQ